MILDERVMAFAFIVPVSGIFQPPSAMLAAALSYSPTALIETPLPLGVPPVKLLGEESGSIVVGAENVSTFARGAATWLRVAAALPFSREDDELASKRMTELTSGLAVRPISRRPKA